MSSALVFKASHTHTYMNVGLYKQLIGQLLYRFQVYYTLKDEREIHTSVFGNRLAR
jgi:hypothetical protein